MLISFWESGAGLALCEPWAAALDRAVTLPEPKSKNRKRPRWSDIRGRWLTNEELLLQPPETLAQQRPERATPDMGNDHGQLLTDRN
jgi:hypothetical protein